MRTFTLTTEWDWSEEGGGRVLHRRLEDSAGQSAEGGDVFVLQSEALKRERKLREALGSVLNRFRTLDEEWARLSTADFPHKDRIELCAEFDVAALRALLKEE